MRDDWLYLLSTGLLVVAAAAGMWTQNGWTGETWAFVAGGSVTIFAFWWMTGGRAASAVWLRGAAGERLTAQALAGLDEASWTVLHDVSRSTGGNWDHILVGPPGAIVLDTKNWGGRPRIAQDALISGNLRHRGAASRAAAAALSARLAELYGERVWVEPAVVVWGEFQGAKRISGVTYVAGPELRDWLTSLPPATRPHRGARDALRSLRATAAA